MKLQEFIINHMIYAGEVEWDQDTNHLTELDGFIMPPESSGTYLLMSEEEREALKAGSSKSLFRRWKKEYTNKSYFNASSRTGIGNKKSDQMVLKFRDYFMGKDRGKVLVYYMVSEMEVIETVFGERTTVSLKEFYENKLTEMAILEEHNLKLMKQRKS